jgi:hypothetical protein
MVFEEAKKQILKDLEGVPGLDGKCLMANSQLCGLIGGSLTAGLAIHTSTGGWGAHIWVIDSEGQPRDALEDYWHSATQNKPEAFYVMGQGDARIGHYKFTAALACVEDVRRDGINLIRAWRKVRKV